MAKKEFPWFVIEMAKMAIEVDRDYPMIIEYRTKEDFEEKAIELPYELTDRILKIICEYCIENDL